MIILWIVCGVVLAAWWFAQRMCRAASREMPPMPPGDFRQPNARHGLCGHDGSDDA